MATSLDEQEAKGRVKAMTDLEARRQEALAALNNDPTLEAKVRAQEEVEDLEELYAVPSAPEQDLVLPDLRGVPVQQAQMQLNRLGLNSHITTEKSRSVAAPTIRATQPPPGTVVESGSTVTMIVIIPDKTEDEEREDDEERTEDEEEGLDDDGDSKSEFDDYQNRESLDESEKALQEQEAQGQGRLKDLKEGVKEGVEQEAKEAAKQVGKEALETAAEGVAEEAGFAAAAAATSEIWIPVGAIILIILAIVVSVLFMIVYISTQCSQPGMKGAILRGASWVSGKLGFTPDLCNTFSIQTTPESLGPQVNRVSDQLTDAEVWAQLQQYGIQRNANAPTTDFNGMRQTTVDEIIWFKHNCNPGGLSCVVVITGGTEPGHAPGACSHEAGFKFDMRPNPIIDTWIMGANPTIGGFMSRAGSRGSEPRFVNPATGAVYVRESNHWDVAVACGSNDVE